jgi:predicted DNA-binding protein
METEMGRKKTIDAKNSKAMSFRLGDDCNSMLKEISEVEDRTQAATIRRLVALEHKRLKRSGEIG